MLVNTGLCNDYILDTDNLIVYDIAGNNFKFNNLYQAVQFMYQAKNYDSKRIDIYNEIVQ